jgi:hypothetical protein
MYGHIFKNRGISPSFTLYFEMIGPELSIPTENWHSEADSGIVP